MATASMRSSARRLGIEVRRAPGAWWDVRSALGFVYSEASMANDIVGGFFVFDDAGWRAISP